MDSIEPEQTPWEVVSHTLSKYTRRYQAQLDKTTPHVLYRWCSLLVLFVLFFTRIIVAQGWYIVVYYLGIYLLNLFIAFLQPQFDPSNEVADDQMEGGTAGNLPTTRDEEFRPFIRLLPEFKFWYKGTRALVIAHICTWMPIFDVPVYWPILFFYWLILFIVPMRRQIRHMIKYRYVPFSIGKTKYNKNNS